MRATPTCGGTGRGDTVVAVSDTTRLPLRVVVLSTVLALVAAGGTYAILSDDAGTDDDVEQLPLTREDPRGPVFTNFDGEVELLASLQGEPVLVNFFASTCIPCITEMPALEEVHQELGDQITFLGLALQDRPDDALALVDQTGVTYRVAQDKDASVIQALGGTSLPTTVLMDAEGRIVARHSGQIDAAALRSFIDEHLGISA